MGTSTNDVQFKGSWVGPKKPKTIELYWVKIARLDMVGRSKMFEKRWTSFMGIHPALFKLI